MTTASPVRRRHDLQQTFQQVSLLSGQQKPTLDSEPPTAASSRDL